MASPVTGIPNFTQQPTTANAASQWTAAQQDPSALVQQFLSLPQGSPQQWQMMQSYSPFLNGNPQVAQAFGGQGALNQWINNASAGALPGEPNAATAIGGSNPGMINYSGATPSFTGQPAPGTGTASPTGTGGVGVNSSGMRTFGQPITDNMAQPQTTQNQQTLGGLATGTSPNGTSTPGSQALGNIPLPAAGAGLNIGQYQNPAAQYMQQWADKGLQSAYAGAGDLLSGPAMQGISQYDQMAALNNSYAPAAAIAQQQQQAGTNLGEYNQQFGYNQALNNQTIPFSQQMQLANLGLQGTQGQQGVTNLLATLQAQLAQSLGQAQGAGTQGGAGQISSAIQQMLSNYLQQNLLGRIPSLNTNTGTGGP